MNYRLLIATIVLLGLSTLSMAGTVTKTPTKSPPPPPSIKPPVKSKKPPKPPTTKPAAPRVQFSI